MEERNCFVYEDYRMDNWTCCYVGMGSKNEENGYNRLEKAERNDHHDRIMNKYGIVRTIIRDNLTREEANALEEARIYYYVFALGYTIDIKGYIKGKKSDSHLTNQTWGGDGVKGCNPFANKTEEEVREIGRKISEALIGEKHPMYGKYHSEKTRKEMSEIHNERYANMSEEERKEKYGRQGEKHPMYGKYHSEKTRKEMSEVRKGKYKGENNPMYGKHHTEETKKKISDNHADFKGENNPSARKVRCHTGEIFNTLTEASEWCGLKGIGNITHCCQGKRKSAGKHPVTREKLHWEYVD